MSVNVELDFMNANVLITVMGTKEDVQKLWDALSEPNEYGGTGIRLDRESIHFVGKFQKPTWGAKGEMDNIPEYPKWDTFKDLFADFPTLGKRLSVFSDDSEIMYNWSGVNEPKYSSEERVLSRDLISTPELIKGYEIMNAIILFTDDIELRMEKGMTDIIQHTVNYSLDELKELVNSPMDNKLFQKIKRYMHLITCNKNLSGEVFRKYPLSPSPATFECSNLGRIRINGDICKPVEEKPGWLYVYFDKQRYPVYRIVAETWCVCPSGDSSDWQVHHITNDGYDNTPGNLIWIKGDAHKKIGTPREQKMKITFDENDEEIKRIIEELNS